MNKPVKYTKEWCDIKKKTCKVCVQTNYYCKRHEPRVTRRSARSWGTMHHQEKCPLYLQLTNADSKIQAYAVVRFCAIVQINFTLPGFNGYDIKCPDCDGWDVTVSKQ